MPRDPRAPARAPLTAAQRDLAERYIPLAMKMALPRCRAWPRLREEFESAAMMALVEAAESFDPCRGVCFAVFARLRIFGALRDVQRREILSGFRSRPDDAPHLGGLTAKSEECGQVLGATAGPPVGDDQADLDAVLWRLDRLPSLHARVMRQVYVHGQTQTQAAAALGISQTRCCVLHRESLALLRESAHARAEET